jgi:hypothetical protein
MKAILIKRKNHYDLFEETRLISTTECEDGTVNKLSKQNCDEIFGVIDSFYESISKLNTSYLKGFNKAMELNKDKQFTIEDMKRAFIAGSNFTSPDEVVLNETFGQSMNRLIKSLQQPTEIEVEIEMEEYGYCEGCRRAGMWHCAHADTCGNAETRERPKLDENGCLILKKL